MSDNFITLMKSLRESGAESLEEIAQGYLEQVESGYADAYLLGIEVKRLLDLIDIIKPELTSLIVDELNVFEGLQSNGYKVEIFNSATRLDYSENESWKEKEEQIKELKKAQKPIEKKMSLAYKNGGSFFDEDSGEVFPPAKYKSGGATTYRITKVKESK